MRTDPSAGSFVMMEQQLTTNQSLSFIFGLGNKLCCCFFGNQNEIDIERLISHLLDEDRRRKDVGAGPADIGDANTGSALYSNRRDLSSLTVTDRHATIAIGMVTGKITVGFFTLRIFKTHIFSIQLHLN